MPTIEKRFRRHEGSMDIIPTEQELAMPIWGLLIGLAGFFLLSAVGYILSRRPK